MAIGFVWPTMAQQKDAPDPELRQMIDSFAKSRGPLRNFTRTGFGNFISATILQRPISIPPTL
jgi:hypothetical protein